MALRDIDDDNSIIVNSLAKKLNSCLKDAQNFLQDDEGVIRIKIWKF